jgi:hypothetical protein
MLFPLSADNDLTCTSGVLPTNPSTPLKDFANAVIVLIVTIGQLTFLPHTQCQLQLQTIMSRREQLEVWRKQRQQLKDSSSRVTNKENIDTRKETSLAKTLPKTNILKQNTRNTVKYNPLGEQPSQNLKHGLEDALKEIDIIADRSTDRQNSNQEQPSLLLHVSVIQHNDLSDEDMDESFSQVFNEQQEKHDNAQPNDTPFLASPINDKRASIATDWSSLLETPNRSLFVPSNDETSSGFAFSFEQEENKLPQHDISFFIKRTVELDEQLQHITKERDMWKERYLTLQQMSRTKAEGDF